MTDTTPIEAARAAVREQMQASLTALTIALAAAPPDHWVLENQGFYLRFDTDGKPHSCGLLQARIFRDADEARELSRDIRNGNGRKPLVVRYEAALAHEIAGYAHAVETLGSAR